MLRRRLLLERPQIRLLHSTTRWQRATSVIDIDNGTFYRQFPAQADTPESNPPLFSKLLFRLPKDVDNEGKPQYWAVLSPSSVARTTFLQVLAAQHICIPPQARRYPLLTELATSPQHAVKYVGFDADRGSNVGGNNVRGAYLSARYESRREETDYTVENYLTGHTELNALEHELTEFQRLKIQETVEQFNLGNLLQMPVANLSNGQTRRARIAKALVSVPEVLLLDGPFMGLDPNTARNIDKLLHALAETRKPRLIMSLRPEDGVPDWITHLVIVSDTMQILAQGDKKEILSKGESGANGSLERIVKATGQSRQGMSRVSKDGWTQNSPALPPGDALVEMQGVKVSYEEKTVLGDWVENVEGERRPGLWWNLHRGQRCGIFGANGSGKTTMLSLITSDHPQTYSLPIKLFGRSRLPGPGELGISLFDLQRKMGHSSPEVHAFFPKNLTARRVLESAWSDAPLAKAKLDVEADRKVDAILRWFARDLHPGYQGKTFLEALQENRIGDKRKSLDNQLAMKYYNENFYDDSDLLWAEEVRFRDLSFSNQRLLLFLRALVARPDLVILDEALSGIDEHVRQRALLFLSHGENISYVKNGKAHPSVLAELGKVAFEGLGPEQALLIISHSKEDVPGCIREWICLPEPGHGLVPRTGTLTGPLELNPDQWMNGIWGQGMV